MAGSERKYLDQADETRTFERGKADLVNIGGGVVGRLTLEPGWRWSEHVKPIAKTEWCEAPHFQYHAAGRLHIKMQDGFKVPQTTIINMLFIFIILSLLIGNNT